MSYLREGDDVYLDELGFFTVLRVGPGEEVSVYDGCIEAKIVHANTLTLMCGECGTEPADRFLLDGAAYCGTCDPDGTMPVRPVPGKLVYCGCGDALDDAPSAGTLTVGDTIAEYRTCAHCRSTRPWMAADHVRGRRVVLYENPETSEVSAEFETVDSALLTVEASKVPVGAQLIRNGALIAEVIAGPAKMQAWKIMPPTHEDPLTDAIRVINPSNPPKPNQEQQS